MYLKWKIKDKGMHCLIGLESQQRKKNPASNEFGTEHTCPSVLRSSLPSGTVMDNLDAGVESLREDA